MDDKPDPREVRLLELFKEAPELERRALDLQSSQTSPADLGQVQAFRDDYLTWYGRCLAIMPDDLVAKFKDLYEGGAFIRRIRHFLEAPTERNSLSASEPSLASNPLVPYWQAPVGTTFVPSLLGQRQVLQQALEEHRKALSPEAALKVESMCRRFPLVLRELGHRHGGREGLTFNDEYDLQDFVHAIMVGMFDDVRPEESTPSYAGGSSRLDFLLKREKVVVETKFARVGDDAKRFRDELAQDLLRFQVHPDCEILVCFVYDPGRAIANPRGFEQDLTAAQGNLAVRVAVVQG